MKRLLKVTRFAHGAGRFVLIHLRCDRVGDQTQPPDQDELGAWVLARVTGA